MNIDRTQLPCGRYCGTVYSIPRLVNPPEIHRAALKDGWGVRQIDGKRTLVCTRCAGQDHSETKAGPS